MYHIRHRYDNVGEFYDDAIFRFLWSSGVTPIKIVTVDGRPLIPPFARGTLFSDFSEGVEAMHRIGWTR